MALVRVAQYNSTPTVVEDYQAQNAHLQAFTNQLMSQQFILDSGTAQPVIKQGCYVSHGGSLYIADADTPITGSPSDGSVYIRVSGTTSLTVEFVTDISGYAWNPVYTALTSGSYTLLPYLIVKASTVWTRYNFNPNNQQFGSLVVTGAITDKNSNNVITPTHLSITIDASSAPVSVYIPDMEIGEIKIIKASLITGGTGKRASLLYPATGKYIRAGFGEAYDSTGGAWAANETPSPTTRVFYGFAMRVE